MHTKISSGKEHRRHRARRGLGAIGGAGAAVYHAANGPLHGGGCRPAEEEPALVPAPEEALPEPEDSMTKEEETDEQPAERSPLKTRPCGGRHGGMLCGTGWHLVPGDHGANRRAICRWQRKAPLLYNGGGAGGGIWRLRL